MVEVFGVAGAGKSTLAQNLAGRLAALGHAAADSRSTRRTSYGLAERVAAFVGAAPECLRAAIFVVGRILRADLPPSALSRLGPAFQHSRQLRLLVRAQGANGVAVQEPGWLMDLLTQYVHARQPLGLDVARRYLARGPGCDAAIVLRASPEVSLRHMRSRKRGLPQSVRAFGETELDAFLRRGDAAAATVAAACRAAGTTTLEIDVDALDAKAVLESCLGFLLPLLPEPSSS